MRESDYLDQAFQEKAQATQRRYSIEFKRQIVQEYQTGETLHGLTKRHSMRIPTKSASDSERRRPPIPIKAGQRFR